MLCTDKLLNLPSTLEMAENQLLENKKKIRKLQSSFRKRKRENSHDPIMSATKYLSLKLSSFSVIFLTMIGFIVDSTSLIVRCSKCKTEYSVDEMEQLSDDELNHKHSLENCNCSVLAKILHEYMGSLRMVSKQTLFAQQQQSKTKAGYSPAKTIIPPTCCASDFKDYNARFNSFDSISPQHQKSRTELAKAGFYAINRHHKDGVCCHSCKLEIFDLTNITENIWKYHARLSPFCSFIRLQKGDKFIENIFDEQEQTTINATVNRKPSSNVNIRGVRKPVSKEDVMKFNIPTSWIQKITEMKFSMDCLLLVYLWARYSEQSRSFDTVEQFIPYMLDKREVAERNFEKISHLWPTDYDEQPATLEDVEEEFVDRFGNIVVVDSEIKIDYNKTCRICHSKPGNMLFRPCSHMIACEKCTRRMKICLICREPIESVIPVTL